MDYQAVIDLAERFKIPIALSLVGIVLIAGGLFLSPESQPKEFPKESIVSNKEINVDVSGAVASPGVYKLIEGSRVEDAIKLAGGISVEANSQYVAKSLNLAQKLVDGSKIYIPFEGEAVSPGVVAGTSSTESQININSATQAELEALPGIGPVTASKIISARPYMSIDELLNKKVVSKATFEKIKDLITLY